MTMTYDYECECGTQIHFSVEPLKPGRYSGPPDKCYPDEGGEVDGPDHCPNCNKAIDFDLVYELAALDDEPNFDDFDDR